MTAAQSLKVYEILGKHFNNTEDAKIVVTEIEQIIEAKLTDKQDVLATKEDINKLQLPQKEMQIDMEKRFNQLTIWIVGVFIALTGIIIAVAKLKG
jgi:hypothetical protein